MKIMVLSNGNLQVNDVANTDGFRDIIGGYIEIPYMGEELYKNGIDMIINEEGKLIDGLRKEIVVIEKASGKVLDIVFGNCIFAGCDEDGDTIGLTDKQIEIVNNMLSDNAMLSDGSIVRVMYI